MSSCFFSSREKIRISLRSESRKCLRTVEPKEPVPPVIISVAFEKLFINSVNLPVVEINQYKQYKEAINIMLIRIESIK